MKPAVHSIAIGARKLFAVSTALCFFTIASIAASVAQTASVIVKLGNNADIASVAGSTETLVTGSIPSAQIYRLTARTAAGMATLIQKLASKSGVVSAEADLAVSQVEFSSSHILFAADFGFNSSLYTNQNAFDVVDLGITHSITRGAGVVVAVLDTGVKADHPDLVGHLKTGYNVLNPTSTPDDAADGVTNVAVGHGTMVSGIIAKIAPSAKILPVRVLNGDGVGTLFSVLNGLYYAIANNANVINFSAGTYSNSNLVRAAYNAAAQAGIVLVSAAGNDSTDTPLYPAALSSVIGVGSVTNSGVLAWYSNFGTNVQVVAPGNGIYSTYVTGGYASWSGTSFATPFVAGEAALLFAIDPDIEAGDVKRAIYQTANSVNGVNPGYAGKLGRGLIDIQSAVFSLLDD